MVPNATEPPAENLPRLLVIAPDVVGTKMAGPGLRYASIARALSSSMPVTFAIGVEGSSVAEDSVGTASLREYQNADALRSLVDECDVIFGQFIDTNVAEYAVRNGKRIVFDLYNVLPAETIGAKKISGFTDDVGKDREYRELLAYFRFCAQAGSYFVTSNTRQRDYWLGFLMAAEGFLPSDFAGRSADEIVGLAPFGLEDVDPVLTHHALRGHYGIEPDDVVLIWAGGIWEWFDADSVIRAVAAAAVDSPKIKLVFYGTTHPNKVVGRPATVDVAMSLAKELGVLGTNVVVLEDWVPASERSNYLLDADIAISAHKPGLETHYAFRTRVLDHFWARLPSIVTDGDWFAEYIYEKQLGVVVPCEDVIALRNAITDLSDDPQKREDRRAHIDEVREQWRWHETTRVLREEIAAKWSHWPIRETPHFGSPTTTDADATPVRPKRSLLRRVLGRVKRELRRLTHRAR